MSNPQGATGNSLGLAIGATNLAGTGEGQRPVVRPAAVTIECGLVLTGFVDRVGDPVPLVAQDGSQHRPEILLAQALDGLARSAANGAPVSVVGVTVPAHWRPQVVEALRAALRSMPGLSRSTLVSDATAALTALRADPGLPSAGVIVLCDFGGSGTSITLVDAAAKDAPIGETVRVPDFSGDRIDQAILTKIVAGIFEASDADPSGTAMVGSLAGLRDECRRAKERLSDETATAIVVDLPGSDTTVRMNRMELDDLIAGPLAEFLAVLVETLDRSRVPLASISAVATVGGGARIPLITQRLSEHLRTKVITTAHPQLTAAERGRADRAPQPVRRDRDRPRPGRSCHCHRRSRGVRDGCGLDGRRRTRMVGGRGRPTRRARSRAAIRGPLRRPAGRQPTGGALRSRRAGRRDPDASAWSDAVVRAVGSGRCDRRGGVRPDHIHAGHPHRAGRHLVEHRAVAGLRAAR